MQLVNFVSSLLLKSTPSGSGPLFSSGSILCSRFDRARGGSQTFLFLHAVRTAPLLGVLWGAGGCGRGTSKENAWDRSGYKNRNKMDRIHAMNAVRWSSQRGTPTRIAKIAPLPWRLVPPTIGFRAVFQRIRWNSKNMSTVETSPGAR